MAPPHRRPGRAARPPCRRPNPPPTFCLLALGPGPFLEWALPMRTAGFTLVALLLAPPLHAQNGWRPLFDGRTLDGWYACNGTAPFAVEDGTIKGTTVINSPNSFLCTNARFADFILEYEVWVATNLNSGVQIRSSADPAVKNGRVHGLQVGLVPSARDWSGG
ncbi:MAG: DUF1080 domain-containing protein, partial [Gemmatimonadetes bacterium]|nr:DUF1080 domain-containing protein [Gemmatimonadota bacterium]